MKELNLPQSPLTRRVFFKQASAGAVAGFVAAHGNNHARAAEAVSRGDDITGVRVERVRHLGAQFLDNELNITGMDGATSLVLPLKKSLWIFGDTVEGPFKSIHDVDLAPLRSNTVAIVPRQDASHGIKRFQFLADESGKRPRQLVPFAPDEDPAVHRVWAVHGTCVGSEVYLFYHRISLLQGVDVFANFQLDGMGIARGNVDDLRFTRLIASDGTLEFWKGDQPTYGVFVERDGEHVYLWGSLMTGMYLARTRAASISDADAYEYLIEAPTEKNPSATARWGKSFVPSAVLFDSVPNEMSAAYNPHLKKHVAFHTLLRENKIVMRTAPRRTGPWSAPQVVYRPKKENDKDLIYAAKEHPELARENGRIVYITFVSSAKYVPEMIEVTFR